MRQTESDADPYRGIVKYYDLEHDEYEDDLALIEQLVDTVGDPILELACGSGRVLAHLAAAGRRITGVDSSQAMLDTACRRLRSAPGEHVLHKSDMSKVPAGDGFFGIVIVTLNGLLHATTSANQLTVLAEAFRCLDPRGMLYVDIANPAANWPSSGIQPVLLEGVWNSAGGEMVQKFQSVSVDPGQQIVSTTLWYDVVTSIGGLSREITAFDLRYVHASELELMLQRTGFAEWQIYGDYALEPYTAESPRIIALAEKTTSR